MVHVLGFRSEVKYVEKRRVMGRFDFEISKKEKQIDRLSEVLDEVINDITNEVKSFISNSVNHEVSDCCPYNNYVLSASILRFFKCVDSFVYSEFRIDFGSEKLAPSLYISPIVDFADDEDSSEWDELLAETIGKEANAIAVLSKEQLEFLDEGDGYYAHDKIIRRDRLTPELKEKISNIILQYCDDVYRKSTPTP